MQGTTSGYAALVAALLALGAGAAGADGIYDRKLERAVKAIVAKKVGTLRGSLEREWRPPVAQLDMLIDMPSKPSVARAKQAIGKPKPAKGQAASLDTLRPVLPAELDRNPVASIARIDG